MIFVYVAHGPEGENKPYPVNKRQLIRLYLPFIQYTYLPNSVYVYVIYTHIANNIYIYILL